MPHLRLEISAQLAHQCQELLEAGHQVMLESELTYNPDTKSRAVVLDDFRVGDAASDAFIHAEVHLLQKPERTDAAQKKLADAIVSALEHTLEKPEHLSVQISCDMILMNSAAYGKKRLD